MPAHAIDIHDDAPTPNPADINPIVVLAAGEGSRMLAADSNDQTTDKLVRVVAGRPLLQWTLDVVGMVTGLAARAAGVHATSRTVYVVVRDDTSAVADLVRESGAQPVAAPDAHRGMAWSIAAGLAAVPPSAQGVTVVLGDDPLAALALPRVLGEARLHPLSAIAVSRTPPVPHPVYVPRDLWPRTPQEDDDHGLRALLAVAPNVRSVSMPDTVPAPIDADDPASLAALEERLAALAASRV